MYLSSKRGAEWSSEGPACGGFTNSEVSRSHTVQFWNVVFVKFPVGVDQDATLPWLSGFQIIADRVVAEIIKDLERKEETGGMDEGVPVEYGAVYDLRMASMAAGVNGLIQIPLLQIGKRRRNLYDFEFGPLIDLRIHVSYIIQYVEHQSPVPGSHFVYG